MYATLNGAEVFYTLHGQGHPMLLMHGGPGLDHTHLRPWLDALGGSRQLIYYDQLGHGRSSRPERFDGIGIDTWADEADALRAYLGHAHILLSGFSFGSLIAQEYALRYGEHLEGLILCGAAPVLDYPQVLVASVQERGTPEQVQMVISRLTNPARLSDDAALRQAWKTILPLYFHAYDPQVGAALDEHTRYSGPAFSHACSRCVPLFTTLSRLDQIATPTLVLVGRHDWETPLAYGAERLHAGLAHSRLVVFEHSGHFPFIEERELFLATVAQWIASLG